MEACGHNYYGQLGNGTKKYKNRPIKIMNNVIEVGVGEDKTVALKKDGSLYSWGSSGSKPKKIMSNVIAISEDGYRVIKKDGSLWTWGSNYWGQLGDGTTEARDKPKKIMSNVISISVSAYYSMAIKKDGSLWTWGANCCGQLGDGTLKDKHKPQKIMKKVMLPTKVQKITLLGTVKRVTSGKKVALKVIIIPKTAVNQKIKWTTSNKKYATVNSKGVVTTKKAGKGKTVKITATALGGSKKKISIRFKII